jgi:uncharacterized membrane protein YphA (DoxX/SURF4 family)
MTFRESSTSFAGTTGVERFPRIDFSRPAFTAHFGATFEIVCGLLVLTGSQRFPFSSSSALLS